MNQDLERELIEFPLKVNSRIACNLRRSSQSGQLDASGTALKKTKQRVLLMLVMGFLAYRWLYSSSLQGCIVDLAHQQTVTLNRLINLNEGFYQIVVTIAQQSIQLNIFFIFLVSTLYVRNLRVHLFFFLFYSIRGVLLNVERFPYPPNIRWDEPWMPSITVPYGITRDYFYSGHTGLMLFSTLWWRYMGIKWLYYPNLLLTPFVVMVLLSTRVHYSIDIVAAVIFTLWLRGHVLSYVALYDRFWSALLVWLVSIISRIRTYLT